MSLSGAVTFDPATSSLAVSPVYQIGLKIAQINTALRNYGLLT